VHGFYCLGEFQKHSFITDIGNQAILRAFVMEAKASRSQHLMSRESPFTAFGGSLYIHVYAPIGPKPLSSDTLPAFSSVTVRWQVVIDPAPVAIIAVGGGRP
jgi:hypothetical protein